MFGDGCKSGMTKPVKRPRTTFSYCVTAKSRIIHTGTHEHRPISSPLTHIPRFIVLWMHKPPSTHPRDSCVSRTPILQGERLVQNFATYTRTNTATKSPRVEAPPHSPPQMRSGRNVGPHLCITDGGGLLWIFRSRNKKVGVEHFTSLVNQGGGVAVERSSRV